MGRTIQDINVADVEKRKVPNKHYVYVAYVTWSDSSTNVIYRRYSRFFDLQNRIMELFPEESGTMDPEKRIIPFLPGKKFFGRSHIREVAIKRLAPIAEYCKAIVKLPRKISQSKDVLEFFEIDPDDINPPKGKRASVKGSQISDPKPLEVYIAVSDYKKQEKGEVALKMGMLVEIVEKTETGWWFVNVEEEQGWVPSTCLEREDGVKEESSTTFHPGQEEQYLCTEEFSAQGEDEVSMERGAVVDVVEKNLEGWWKVRYSGREGYVPATYLIKTESFKIRKQKPEEKRTKGPEIVRSLQEVSDLLQNKSTSSTIITNIPTNVSTNVSTDLVDDDVDDEFDDDDEGLYEDPEDEKIYTIQELSKILREDKKDAETEEVYESILSLKSRSLKRGGSIRPPPRPPVKPKVGSKSAVTEKPQLKRIVSVAKDYITIADFSDVVGDGISFQAGQNVKVMEKSEGGWWYIELDGKEGWAPASYIQEMSSDAARDRLPAPDPKQKSKSRDGSIEDLTKGDQKSGSPRRRLSAVESIGELANALKSKINKGNKSPPPPPKKDFLDEPEDGSGRYITPVANGNKSNDGETVRPSTSKFGNALRPTTGPKKPLDRSLLHAPPPAPPVKDSAKHDPPDIPKFSLPNRGQKEGNSGPSARVKPKPPAKVVTRSASEDEPSEVQGSVAGIAGALKAKFEVKGGGQNKPAPPSFAQKPKLTATPSTTPKPKIDAAKVAVRPGFNPKPPFKVGPSKPEVPTSARPAVPSVTNKPNIGGKPQPPSAAKPSWVKNKPESKPDNVPSNRESANQKVSDLASMLQSKFENRQKPSEGETNRTSQHVDTKPPPPSTPSKPMSSLKPVNKPPRPDTPPSPRRSVSPARMTGRSSSPLSGTGRVASSPDARKSNANKYSSRPLPPMPGGKPKLQTNLPAEADSKPAGTKSVPSLPTKPKAVKTQSAIGAGTSEAEETKPIGVSGLANALKARLGGANMGGNPTPSGDNARTPAKVIPQVPSKPKANVNKTIKNDEQITNEENNNSSSVNDNMYCATTDYHSTDEGAISLRAGEHVEVLETADDWWFVCSGNNEEGWVPSAYLEKVKSSSSKHSDSKVESKSNNNKSKSAVFYTISDFIAENEGEIDVTSGTEVTVIDSPDGGWWFIRVGRNEGWIPASYLEQM